MSIINLALEACNTTVSEFSHLVDHSSVSGTSSSSSSILGVVSSVSSKFTSNYSTSKLSKLSSYAGSFISSSAKNIVCGIASSILGHKSDVSQSGIKTTLNKVLYDKSLNLPEAKSISFAYSDDNSRQYCKFTGSKIFSDFYGTINNSLKDIKSFSGWVTLNTKSENYVWITNNVTTYIVEINEISPLPIIEDLQQLYDKLKDNLFSSIESIINDTKIAQSIATTLKDETSDAINSGAEDLEKNIIGTSFLSDSKSSKKDNKSSKFTPEKLLGVVYPKQISKPTSKLINDSVYNNVQAVVYDLSLSDDSNPLTSGQSGFDKARTTLLCYQQPENISYTAASQYDAVTPRGAQQPLQFYISANAMSLNFSLKWHIDEIRTLLDASGESYSIQDIAQIAEDFTRPWKRGDSIEPKLCKVILPGVQHIGYITEAQISYSGDMTGDYATGGGVLTSAAASTSSNNTTVRGVTNYFYSQIDITFSMIIIKDITLRQKDESSKREVLIDPIPETISDAAQTYSPDVKNDSDGKDSKDIKENSGDSTKPITTVAYETTMNALGISTTNQSTEHDYKYTKEDDALVIIDQNNGNKYYAESKPGLFKDKSGTELFVSNGNFYEITSTDALGDKYYTVPDSTSVTGYKNVKAEYAEGSILDTAYGIAIPI